MARTGEATKTRISGVALSSNPFALDKRGTFQGSAVECAKDRLMRCAAVKDANAQERRYAAPPFAYI
jgi:hypothetical protein